MKCQLHWEREAVRFCQECGAPLCAECNSTLGTLCANCTEKSAQNGKKEILTTFGISAIAFLVGVWWQADGGYFQTDPIEAFITCLLFIFFPFGWKGISKVTDYVLVIASAFGWMGWVLYFVFKFVFALFLGWIFGVPKMLEMIRLWKVYENAENIVKNMKMMPQSRVINE